jgi:hypothetical protein
MNVPSDQVFAHTTLARDQHLAVGRRGTRGRFEQRDHLRAGDNERGAS